MIASDLVRESSTRYTIPQAATLRALELLAPAGTPHDTLLDVSYERSKQLDCVPVYHLSDAIVVAVAAPPDPALQTRLSTALRGARVHLYQLSAPELTTLRATSYRYALSAPKALHKLAKSQAIALDVIPLCIEDGELVVGMVNPRDTSDRQSIESIVTQRIRPIRLLLDDIKERISRYYAASVSVDTTETGSLISDMLATASRRHASDIHIAPLDDAHGGVYFSIDGELDLWKRFPVETVHALRESLLTRAEVVQSGDTTIGHNARLSYSIEGGVKDLRLASCPTIFGPDLVIRIGTPADIIRSLEESGMIDPILSRYKRLLSYPDGMLVVVGPLGHGKTSLVHSSMEYQAIVLIERKLGRALRLGERPNWDLVTKAFRSAEEPVETRLPWVRQTHVERDGRFTFANAIEQFVRMNAGILFMGEMRDRLSVAAAIESSLLGHFVFSTSHARDSLRALHRLKAKGAELQDLAAGTVGILSERLLWKLCVHCRKPVAANKLDETFVALVKTHLGADRLAGAHVFEPHGCTSCHGGYTGRFGIFELFEITDDAEDAIVKEAATRDLMKTDPNFQPLIVDALNRILAGQTSIEEARKFVRWHA
jgi:type II secretory ATPase GspE/PulE/Tfp pilus assembly ATPase PilB-like protein